MPTPLGVLADFVNALAPMVGGVTIAAYLLGLTIVSITFLAICLLLDSTAPFVILTAAGFGICVVVGVGLWDMWTVIFIGILLAWLLVNPLRAGDST